ncbi:hypothetical protein CHS0354_015950 [Potamilus streckersoni]|uniref:Uncharacterized protein n=1 Tax=Potamilus streckersoni TaxID=2493646 RepID=A0AAE0SZC0_9BIVA|nr:hypothetical protein CHS0354_015950 [Potamilus streckersoni]
MAREEKMIFNIVRKTLKKINKRYIQAYGQTEDRRRIYKATSIRLESQTGSKEVLKQALRVKVQEANSFVKALKLEETAI